MDVVVDNVGPGPLTVHELALAGPGAASYSVEGPELPAVIAPGEEGLTVSVVFAPEAEMLYVGILQVRSDDPERAEADVSVVGWGERPCLAVDPVELDFGAVAVGDSRSQSVSVTNCGEVALNLLAAELAEGSSVDFAVAELPEGLGGEEGEGESAPLPAGATVEIVVVYTPDGPGDDGGRLILRTNVPDREIVEVDLVGRGGQPTPPSCLAEGRIAGDPEFGLHPDGENALETIPLATVELRGAGSSDPDGRIVAWRWHVLERPVDSGAEIQPNADQADVTFRLDLVGDYVFSLIVTDNAGLESVPDCRVVVQSRPSKDIHVQLVWDTPADEPDQQDAGVGAGSDMDLHLLHPLGEWFCAPRDVHWANPNPDWGVPFDRTDDPVLLLDDSDGAGPEIIEFDHPENNRVYRVGAHYFNDHGYGASFTTVRIFIRGVLHFEIANKRMSATDQFWYVALIAWPSGATTPVDQLFDVPPGEACN
jgi:hypothetical protein